MESLFARYTPKRGRVFLMLAGSLLAHGGLVGIGALLTPPVLPDVVVDWPVQEAEGPAPMKVIDPVEQLPSVDVGPTATPEVVPTVVSTPPPMLDEPVFAEPSSPTPRLKTVVRPRTTAQTLATYASSSAPSTPGSGMPSSMSNNSPAGTSAWVMPHPPYPAAVHRLMATSGLTTVRITTDATGRVSNIVIVRSAGNPSLDAHTVNYVRENWHGPANASRTTEFLYQLR